MHKLTTYLKVVSRSRDHQRLFLNVNEIMRLQKRCRESFRLNLQNVAALVVVQTVH